jgi:hypothetical protein
VALNVILAAGFRVFFIVLLGAFDVVRGDTHTSIEADSVNGVVFSKMV